MGRVLLPAPTRRLYHDPYCFILRHQPGGVFTIDDLEQHPGDILFVNNTATAATGATGYGQNPDAPFATLDYMPSGNAPPVTAM